MKHFEMSLTFRLLLYVWESLGRSPAEEKAAQSHFLLILPSGVSSFSFLSKSVSEMFF